MSLRAGRSVRIQGLQNKTELNGQYGKVVRQEGERWVVQVPRLVRQEGAQGNIKRWVVQGLDEVTLGPERLVVEEPPSSIYNVPMSKQTAISLTSALPGVSSSYMN
jgi:hypothetical protein